MEFGYITFSAKEQELVHNVLKQLTEGAIDELGLGRIRDAFSDLMFPGMSTLHRKSKYFVLLPALYSQLSQTDIPDKNKISSLIRKWEINMTISLLNGNANPEGITGSSAGIDGLRRGQFVKYRPTHIYLSSLKYFELVSDRMNLTDLIYQQSLINKNAKSSKKKSNKEEDKEEEEVVVNKSGAAQNFVPFPGYDFSEVSSIDLRLNTYEARILKDKIINKCCIDGNDNLFSYILKNNDIDIVDDFFDMRDTVDSFPDNLKRVYNLAYDFSEWAHLMNTYYRYAFYLKKNDTKAETVQKEEIEKILLAKHYPSRDRLEEILQYVKTVPFFNDVNGLCQFCREAAECLGDKNKENELINLITKRE